MLGNVHRFRDVLKRRGLELPMSSRIGTQEVSLTRIDRHHSILCGGLKFAGLFGESSVSGSDRKDMSLGARMVDPSSRRPPTSTSQ